MRSVLALALVLLGITLALDRAPELAPRPSGEAADRALEIVVAAKGPLLPLPELGGGPERLEPALRVGDRTLVSDAPHGLHAAFVGPDSVVRAEALYDVAHAPADAGALAEALEEARQGELLVLASRGLLQPEGGAPSAAFERALALLGARARPGTATPESWALVALRGERGWVPLAEGYGTDSGVALAFVLGADRARYADFDGDLVRVRAGARRDVELCAELPYARRRTPGVALVRDRSVRGQPLEALLVPPRVDEDGRARAGEVAWEGVTVGEGACVTALVGLADGAAAGSDGVVFRASFDGEPLERERTIVPETPWKRAFFDLRPYAGRTGTLVLAVDPRSTATGDDALLGRPLLLSGYERSPLEVWAEER